NNTNLLVGKDIDQIPKCETDDGFKLEAGGGLMQGKYFKDRSAVDDGFQGNVKSVGVSNGEPFNPDIPAGINFGEYIDLTLPEGGGILKSLDLGALYPLGEFGQQVYEIAAAAPNISGIAGTLTIKDKSTAVWSWMDGSREIKAISNSTDRKSDIQGGGWYSISNPFADTFLTSLRLAPVSQPGVPPLSVQNSDFGLVGAEFEKVDEPTAFAGLALVGAFLMNVCRRKARKIG
ncbi:hypothetical protein H6S82_31860, partial [Planktothrix sp. FACHB-1355]